MKTITFKADAKKLNDVLSFVDQELEEIACPMKHQMKLDMAVEEIFINVANYAYGDTEGEVEISVDADESIPGVTISFVDSGTPYNPLEHEDPDVTLSAEEREIGGLGILLVKKTMDDVKYQYQDDKNILTISYSWA